MTIIRLIRLAIASVALSAAVVIAQTPSQWDQPAEALSQQVASILGSGQSQLTIRNNSSISTDQIPTIRKLLEQDLKAHGVQVSGAESASTIRITFSENLRERLWVAEVIEGSETRVAMVSAGPALRQAASGGGEMTLRKQLVIFSKAPVLAALETRGGLIAVEPEEIVVFDRASVRGQEAGHFSIGQKRALPRDPRAVLWPAVSDIGFEANAAGTACTGDYDATMSPGKWSIRCHESDDPWQIGQAPIAQMSVNSAGSSGTTSIKAFYNAARDNFTGVVTPSVGVDLQPFYSAALLPRASGGALLIGGVDGKVQLVENGAIEPVSGARDWGSDFAVLHSGCGMGDQVIVSGSGTALSDSLRAYELPALEAIPASLPLATDGTLTALWSAPDGKSVFATVRHATGDYEVDRVTALCD